MNLRYEVLPRPYGKRIRLPRAAEITSRRSNRRVATQREIRRDVIPATSCSHQVSLI